MGIFSNLKQKITGKLQAWREIGEYRSIFRSFGSEAYKSELVRSCIRPLADFTSKANCVCKNKSIEQLLNIRPNMYMNGKEFLYKVRTVYELKNNCFIYIQREGGQVTGFFPIVYNSLEAMEYNGRLYVQFTFTGNTEKVIFPWDDLAVVRKDYNSSNIVGDDNSAIIDTLELISTTNQGISNAVRATANLRGILKSTKAMLSPEDIKKNKDAFVKDYLSLSNEGGIASLDATQEFTPISMSPVITTYSQMKEFRENVYRYFGVNDEIIMGTPDTARLESFYETRIEPFLVDLSTELTSKVFSDKQRAFGNWIVFEANKLQFCSIKEKVEVFKTVVLYGGMTINEWRLGCNMAPVSWGDEPIRRLDAGAIVEDVDPDGGANLPAPAEDENGE